MKKKNTAEQYLSQKIFSVFDVIFIGIIISGALIFTFAYGFGYMGIPIMAIGTLALFFSLSSKIKDEEYDSVLKKLLSDNGITVDSRNMLCTYVLGTDTLKIGKDGKLRSDVYSVAFFDFEAEFCKVTVHTANICQSTVYSAEHLIPNGCDMQIEENEIATAAGKRKIAFLLLICDGNTVRIPFDASSIDVEHIMKKFEK